MRSRINLLKSFYKEIPNKQWGAVLVKVDLNQEKLKLQERLTKILNIENLGNIINKIKNKRAPKECPKPISRTSKRVKITTLKKLVEELEKVKKEVNKDARKKQ